jgi:hypothetical protein
VSMYKRSNGLEWTGTQLREARNDLRTTAEMLVGRLLFEYSRLETALDLCLVWVDEGSAFDERSKKIECFSFFQKLELLEADVRGLGANAGSPFYLAWVQRGHALREQRNTLVHGRVGFDVTRSIVVVVSSRATSTTLVSNEYNLAELEQVVGEAGILTQELRTLRSSFPLIKQ